MRTFCCAIATASKSGIEAAKSHAKISARDTMLVCLVRRATYDELVGSGMDEVAKSHASIPGCDQ
jgi:hypothetical protein